MINIDNKIKNNINYENKVDNITNIISLNIKSGTIQQRKIHQDY